MKLSEIEEHINGSNGFCPECDDVTQYGGVEPDAEDYDCPQCGGKKLCGMEWALLTGYLEEEEV